MRKFVILACGLLICKTALAAIDCQILPTCEEYGYKDNIGICPNEYIVCPFNKLMGRCLPDARVGQIGYFTKAPGKGWLQCSGSQYSNTNYPELAAFLGSQFCVTAHGGTCSEGYFRVPNYSGYFLRVAGTPSSTYGGSGNSSLIIPQKEQLPNISGTIGLSEVLATSASGAFSQSWSSVGSAWHNRGNGVNVTFNFSAAGSNSIYTSGGHVIPANIGVYAYIYAGRLGSTYELKSCSTGDYYLPDNDVCTKNSGNYIYIGRSNGKAKVYDTSTTSYSTINNYAQVSAIVKSYCSGKGLEAATIAELKSINVAKNVISGLCMGAKDGVITQNNVEITQSTYSTCNGSYVFYGCVRSF